MVAAEMLPPVPQLKDYNVSPQNGFLPTEPPLERLPDPYFGHWESVIANLQRLLLSKRLRDVVDKMPTLDATRLQSEGEWRRAYSILAFLAHGYVWCGPKPSDRLPPSISIPLLRTCEHLELPPVATYAGLVLWNYKPLFDGEPVDTLENIATLNTFTGSLDESWFYLISVALEARGAPLIPLMLGAILAARENDIKTVTDCLRRFAECLDELGSILQKMYDNCDPHVFYHRIRPYLAGSKNMADAGLPNGVIYDEGTGNEVYRQYSGGSNAQSSLIQFFDIVLGIQHHPTGERRSESSESEEGTAPPPRHNFIEEMRSYMPGPHRRFLQHVASVANIREYVESHCSNRGLATAYDACLGMLRAFRDKHIQMVSRYIIVKSREAASKSRNDVSHPVRPVKPPAPSEKLNGERPGQKKLRGTGGTALIPFLKQARDETGEPAIDAWARRLLNNGPADVRRFAIMDKVDEHANGDIEVVGLAGTWAMDESEGGIYHW